MKATPDGYTLLQVGTPNAINAALYSNLSFNFIRDIAPVAGIARVFNVLAVHPSVPVTTVPEFITYAKTNPGTLSQAVGGIRNPRSCGRGTIQADDGHQHVVCALSGRGACAYRSARRASAGLFRPRGRVDRPH